MRVGEVYLHAPSGYTRTIIRVGVDLMDVRFADFPHLPTIKVNRAQANGWVEAGLWRLVTDARARVMEGL